jgi:CDP-glycerol glycerophosphotransferase (TagB/SpsB family)
VVAETGASPDAVERFMRSLAAQQHHAVEVVVVGAPADSDDLAALSARCGVVAGTARRVLPRSMTVRTVPAAGEAENVLDTGAAAATGEFITFPELDGRVMPAGYRRAVESLSRTGSDLAVFSHRRLRGGLSLPARPWLREVHTTVRACVDVSCFPAVLANGKTAARVFRTAFWRAARLRLGAMTGPIVDRQLSVLATVRAASLDVLDLPGIESTDPIPPEPWTGDEPIARLREQFADIQLSLTLLQQVGEPALVEARRLQLLASELADLAARLVGSGPDVQTMLGGLLAELIDKVPDERYAAEIPAQFKVLHRLVATGRFEDAEFFIRAGGLVVDEFPTSVGADGPRVHLPGWDDDRSGLPQSDFRLSTGQTRPRTHILAIRLAEPSVLEIDGYAYIQHVEPEAHGQVVEAAAVDESGRVVTLDVGAARQDLQDLVDELVEEGSVFCDYRTAALTVRVPLASLGDGSWRVRLDITGGAQRRTTWWEHAWPAGTANLRHVIDLDGADGTADSGSGKVAVVTGAPSRPLVIDVLRRGHAEAEATGHGRAPSRPAAWVDSVVDGSDGNTLDFVIRFRGDVDGCSATFDTDHVSLSAHLVPIGDDTVCASMPLLTTGWDGEERPIASGTYRVTLVPSRGADVVPVASSALLDRLPDDRVRDDLRLTVQLRPFVPGAVAVAVRPPLAPQERGRRNQHRMRAVANAGSGSERSVFFRTLFGDTTDDSNRAIHEELRRRNTDLTLYWSIRDRSVPVPEGGVGLLENSQEWHERLGNAAYVVVNQHQPLWYAKPSGQVIVQTFHGYPYKGMGQSWWRARDVPTAMVQRLLDRAADWDYLVSPAGYATPHLLREFFTPQAAERVHVIEAGYPRNDVLLSPDRDTIRARVRATLDIADHQTAVLYAPTFRDYLSSNDMTATTVDFFDADTAAHLLGPDYVLLIRGHAFNARANVATVTGPQIRDVTYYPDIADLCLASDTAILDYSSLRFDYALTRKPMIFLVPDKDTYHQLRPALTDYDPTAPGPHLATTRDVVTCLQDLPTLTRHHTPAIETFIATYLEHEDGHATSRVVDTVFGPTAPGRPR